MLPGTGRVLTGFAACEGGLVGSKGDPCQGRVPSPLHQTGIRLDVPRRPWAGNRQAVFDQAFDMEGERFRTVAQHVFSGGADGNATWEVREANAVARLVSVNERDVVHALHSLSPTSLPVDRRNGGHGDVLDRMRHRNTSSPVSVLQLPVAAPGTDAHPAILLQHFDQLATVAFHDSPYHGMPNGEIPPPKHLALLQFARQPPIGARGEWCWRWFGAVNGFDQHGGIGMRQFGPGRVSGVCGTA